MDLRERIDRELMTLPEDPFDLPTTLAQGRRVVRRRRTATALVAAASVAVVSAGIAWGPLLSPSEPATVASQPTSEPCLIDEDPQGSWEPRPCDPQSYLHDGEAATYTLQGELVVRDGWWITQQVDRPLESFPHSIALEVTNGSEIQWTLLKYGNDRSGQGNTVFGQYDNRDDYPDVPDFTTWLDHIKARWLGTPTTVVVEFGPDETLQPLPGWTIEQQRTGLTMGPDYPGPKGATAVAEINDWWYLVRPTEKGAEAFPVIYPYLGQPNTIDGFLDFVHSPDYLPDEQGMLTGNAPEHLGKS
jgi:hypothetical protein